MRRHLSELFRLLDAPTIGFAAGSCVFVFWRLVLTGGSAEAASLVALLWMSLKGIGRRLDAIEARIAAEQAGPIEVEILPMDPAA